MPELDPFDTRLRAAVRSFADRAQTGVDGLTVAERVVRTRRVGAFAWLGRAVPVPVSVILLLGLLLGSLAWTTHVGAPSSRPAPVIQAPAPTATSAATAAPTTTPTPLPSTPGTGDQSVTGSATLGLSTPYTTKKVGDVTELRGGVATIAVQMNDPRAGGTAIFEFSVDEYTTVGLEWGTFTLENDGGAWEGTCSGGAWNAGDSANWACWLVGSGGYKGYSYYLRLSWPNGNLGSQLEGIIYPGSPPAP